MKTSEKKEVKEKVKKEDVILKEAQELFPNTDLANEMAVFDV